MTLTSADINVLIDDAIREAPPSVPESHLFFNEDDAREKAKEMGLTDVHQMDVDGNTFYIPGETHNAYLLARSDFSAELLRDVSVYQI